MDAEIPASRRKPLIASEYYTKHAHSGRAVIAGTIGDPLVWLSAVPCNRVMVAYCICFWNTYGIIIVEPDYDIDRFIGRRLERWKREYERSGGDLGDTEDHRQEVRKRAS